MSEALISQLRQAVAEKDLVVICGAGVSMRTTKGDPRAGWHGLIEFGLKWCDGNDIPLPGTNGLKRAKADLRDGDLLSAADKLQRGLENEKQWTRFLHETFASFRTGPLNHDLVDAILDLGVPVATTNYDTLISARAGVTAVSWRSQSLIAALNSQQIGIAHLHGVWTEPESVVLGVGSYGRLLATEQTMAAEKAISLRSKIVLIGVGESLTDPNFSQLGRYLDAHFHDTGLLHVRIASEEDPDPPSRMQSHFRTLVCGKSRNEIPRFVRGLAPRRPRQGRRTRPPKSRLASNENDSDHVLLGTPLLRGLGPASPTLREFWPDLLIDVRVRTLRQFPPEEMLFSRWRISGTGLARVCIIGPPGGGKSTLLRMVALEYRKSGRQFTLLDAQAMQDGHWSSSGNGHVLLLDGLDELAEPDQEVVAERIAELREGVIWMSCRTDLFSRESPFTAELVRCEEILEIVPLDESDVTHFLEEFSKRSSEARDASRRVIEWEEEAGFSDLLSVPLNLTLAIYLAADPGWSSTPPTNRQELYKRFYWYYIQREVARLGARPADMKEIYRSHIDLAVEMYRHRQGGVVDDRRPRLSRSRSKRRAVVLALLQYDEVGSQPVVRAFVHETVMEWLVAQAIFDAFVAPSADPGAMGVAANDDVNSFIRDLVSVTDEGRRTDIAEILTAKYYATPDERIKEHILYYVGRLDLSSCPTVLIEEFNKEGSWLLRRAAALGAILHGNMAVYRSFMGELERSDEAASINRAVQLVYFGDIAGELHSAKDAGGTWDRTRKALFDRLGRVDVRSVRLRWWDVYTLWSFCVSRGYVLTDSERMIVQISLVSFESVSKADTPMLRELGERLCGR